MVSKSLGTRNQARNENKQQAQQWWAWTRFEETSIKETATPLSGFAPEAENPPQVQSDHVTVKNVRDVTARNFLNNDSEKCKRCDSK